PGRNCSTANRGDSRRWEVPTECFADFSLSRIVLKTNRSRRVEIGREVERCCRAVISAVVEGPGVCDQLLTRAPGTEEVDLAFGYAGEEKRADISPLGLVNK